MLRSSTFLWACLALLDTCKAESHGLVHRAHRRAHHEAGSRGGARGIDQVARYIEQDIEVVTETVYFTTYVEYQEPTTHSTITSTITQTTTVKPSPEGTPSTTQSPLPAVVVVYSTVPVIPVPVDSVFTGLASGTPVTNTFTTSRSSSKSSSTTSKGTKSSHVSKPDGAKAKPETLSKKTTTSKMIIPAATLKSVAATTAALSTAIPAASPVGDSPSANPSYSSGVTDAISAMGSSYSTSSLQWANIHGWTAANVYNDIMDHDFYSNTKQFQSSYGDALFRISTSTDLQGQVLSTDAYNDDQLWWCLAMLRAYQNYGHDELLNQTISQWTAIGAKAQVFRSDQGHSINKGGLPRNDPIPADCDVDGAVYWSNAPDSGLNAISTGLYAQVGAQLFELTGESRFRGPADAALGWLQRMMLSQSTGIMNIDSVSVAGCEKHFGSLTYNTGVYIGALTSFYRKTGEQTYLSSALQSVASSVTGSFGDAASAVPLVIDQQDDIVDTGDDVQWRDVLFRNLVDFYVSLVPRGSVNSDLQGKVQSFFKQNYDQIQSKARFGDLYAANWFGLLRSGSDWGTGSVLSILNGAMMVL